MKALDRTSIEMDKTVGRNNGGFYKRQYNPVDTIDEKKVFFAKRDLANGKKKNIQLAVISSSLPRDELLYR